MSRRPAAASPTLAAVAALALSAAPLLAQAPDTAFARLVREYTSDARFLPPNVASLPTHATVPSPQRHFGTVIGAPGVMHRTAEVQGYFRALDAASPRVRVDSVGVSEEGRPIVVAVIADEATMARLDHYKGQLARLADPRGLPAGPQLEAVLADAKPIYYLNAGLHSPEMGSPEMVMELAYRLAVGDDPAVRKIRDNVIVLINPVAEPDGRDRQVDWYHRYTKGRPEYNDGFPRSTPYWGKYVVHDNNRDGIQLSQALTKAINGVYYDWHPLVMLDLHESVPLLYISTGTGPYNEHNDPIAISEWQLLANHDVTALSALGMPGVWTWGFFDGWWPGYAMWVANNHNSIGRFYETFGNAGADTYVRDLSGQSYAGDPVTERTWYRVWPPTRKVRWGARDNVNYMQAGVLASLEFAADNGPTMLRNFWQKGMNSITRGRTTAPYAYEIPGFARQRDPARTAYLVNQLRRHAIEVHQEQDGDFLIRLDQPYRDLAVNLLSRQNFPSDAQHPPYDDIAWTLGYIYGVQVDAVGDSAALRRTGLTLLADTVAAPGAVRGRGPVHLVAHRAQNELLPALYAMRARLPNATATAAERAFTVGRDSFPAGSLVLEGVDEATARDLAGRFALTMVAAASAPSVPRHAVDLPRVAIYHSWFYTQDEGWARYTFEQYGIPYTSIDKDDLRAGGLRARHDVILVPRLTGPVERMIHGVDSKFGPMPFTRTAETPSFGTPDSTSDMTGGMGFAGLAELERFVREGGTLVTLGDATRLVGETGLARELTPRAAGSLFHPGSVVRAQRRTASPILYGYPAQFTIFRGNGQLFQVADRDSALMVLEYGTRRRTPPRDEGPMMGMATEFGEPRAATSPRTGIAPAGGRADSAAAPAAPAAPAGGGDYVVSGMVRGQEQIVGQGAIFDVPVGQGRVVAFTFDPLHRFLNHADFPLVWNALMHWNDRPGAGPAASAAAGAERGGAAR